MLEVLVLEDQPAVRDVIAEIIEDLEVPVHVGQAASLSEARVMLNEQHGDGLVTDLSLGDGISLDLIAELRSNHATMPIILVSGFLSQDRLQEAEKLDVKHILSKPFDSEVLLECMRKALLPDADISVVKKPSEYKDDHLLPELFEMDRRLGLLYRMFDEMPRQPDVSGVCGAALRLAMEMVHAEDGFLALFQRGRKKMIMVAKHLSAHEDIALNAMTAGWMNEFVEIVLGASIVIPISVGYMGLDWVKANAGFMTAFKTMPYLFSQWGVVLSTLSGVAWFGLLFFAGITSSLAMGTPFMAFLQDEFNVSRNKSSLILGAVILILAIPTILFYQIGVFDEYDYWTGTVSLVVFALLEVVLFSWVIGVDKGWEEIKRGADIKMPLIYKPIMKWITPIFIIVIFVSALIKPVGGGIADWQLAFHQLFTHGTWPFAHDSIIAQMFHIGTPWVYFKNGLPTAMFFKDMSRLLLTLTFAGVAVLVHIAAKKRGKTAKITEP